MSACGLMINKVDNSKVKPPRATIFLAEASIRLIDPSTKQVCCFKQALAFVFNFIEG
jgi:hypothetical protein